MSGQGQPLALANEAFAEQKSWRRREELVDALPYIDGLEPGEKEAVMRLIEEEVRSFLPFGFYGARYLTKV